MLDGDADDDHERRERAERVHVVGGAEPAAAHEGVAESEPLDHRGRDGEADEREPGERGQDETDRSAGNGSQMRTATAPPSRSARASSTSGRPRGTPATKSGIVAQKTTIWTGTCWRTLSWSATASGMPSGSTRQKLLP